MSVKQKPIKRKSNDGTSTTIEAVKYSEVNEFNTSLDPVRVQALLLKPTIQANNITSVIQKVITKSNSRKFDLPVDGIDPGIEAGNPLASNADVTVWFKSSTPQPFCEWIKRMDYLSIAWGWTEFSHSVPLRMKMFKKCSKMRVTFKVNYGGDHARVLAENLQNALTCNFKVSKVKINYLSGLSEPVPFVGSSWTKKRDNFKKKFFGNLATYFGRIAESQPSASTCNVWKG